MRGQGPWLFSNDTCHTKAKDPAGPSHGPFHQRPDFRTNHGTMRMNGVRNDFQFNHGERRGRVMLAATWELARAQKLC